MTTEEASIESASSKPRDQAYRPEPLASEQAGDDTPKEKDADRQPDRKVETCEPWDSKTDNQEEKGENTIERDGPRVSANGGQTGSAIGSSGDHCTFNNETEFNKIKAIFNGVFNILPNTSKESDQKPKEGDEKAKPERAILDFTAKLPAKRPDILALVPEGLDVKLKELREHQIILISCADDDVATAAAYAVFDNLNINDENKRLFDFDRARPEDPDCTISLLTQESKDSSAETAILVNLFGSSNKQFLDSLAADAITSSRIKEALEQNHYLVICLVKPQDVENRQGYSKYPCWSIAFLCYLLGDKYAHLEQQLLNQRERGKWDKDDEEFRGRIKNLINSGQLDEQVKLLENSTEETSLSTLFAGHRLIPDTVLHTVLYTATFFPALNPGEFKETVNSLLGLRTMSVTATTYRQTASGLSEPFETQKEEPLNKIWQTDSDKILKECRLKTFSSKDATRTIRFSEPGLKERLKVYLEEEHSFFLEDQFQYVQKQGLLFHQSPTVSDGVRSIIVEMARSYPYYFDQDWLIGVIKKLKQDTLQEPMNWQKEAPELLPLQRIQGNRVEWCYTRIAQLLRKMLEHPQLGGLVDEFLNRLMGVKLYDSVLHITRRLQFAPEFDLLYWTRQLLERGSQDVRNQTYGFLVQYLKKAGPNVYEALRPVQQWLPSPDTDPRSYNITNLCALELIFRYCRDTTSQFSVEHYGLQPSSYPLFTGSDANTLKANIKLLAEWLFHPGMRFVLKNDDDLMISTLILNWAFILIGPNKESSNSQSPLTTVEEAMNLSEQARDNRDLVISNGLIFGLFLQAVATAIKQPQLNALSNNWKLIAEVMTDSIKALPHTGNQRQDVICIRNLVRDLARQFKPFARNIKANIN